MGERIGSDSEADNRVKNQSENKEDLNEARLQVWRRTLSISKGNGRTLK